MYFYLLYNFRSRNKFYVSVTDRYTELLHVYIDKMNKKRSQAQCNNFWMSQIVYSTENQIQIQTLAQKRNKETTLTTKL